MTTYCGDYDLSDEDTQDDDSLGGLLEEDTEDNGTPWDAEDGELAGAPWDDDNEDLYLSSDDIEVRGRVAGGGVEYDRPARGRR